MVLEIVILAMIAAFLGMRLYSVLGRRAEQEEEIIPASRFDRAEETDAPRQQQPAAATDAPAHDRALTGFPPAVERGLRDIAAADRHFDLIGFMEGARGAYEIVLESFWKGDKDELKAMCDDDVYESFASAIDEREAAGQTLDNRLIRIEDSTIKGAELDGRTARIAVRFVADIASVTRDADGNVIGGSLDDAIESVDVWTFMRDTRSTDPQWLLDETDAG
ncbi:Tim44/TimA family putative adaptor protein [Aurantiacibacter spongiae]|uniref:Tim44 domain-containing protein n=1 Tax=Aurantiacibacter spongiae TaxID=2488860 RepID=A0A3N5CRW2_9SPHN|nr:Tim44/TimA family putative adaptor protein [Aurantiacibacter spongiae]RPF71844.1 Tim44 domain-containing protein [Aurantiacibacter spongiae]